MKRQVDGRGTFRRSQILSLGEKKKKGEKEEEKEREERLDERK